MKKLITTTLLFLFSFLSMGATYTTISANTWSTDGSTDCSCSPGVNDDIVVNHYANMSQGSYSGSVIINAGGEFNINGSLVITASGTFQINDGVIYVHGSLTNNGTVTGSGLLSGSGSAINHGTWPGLLYGDYIPFGAVLPVEFTHVTAEQTSEGVIVNWETASELNNDYFTIERSDDLNFIDIGTVEGGGTKENLSTYSFLDSSEFYSEVYYYRIKQTDYNGDYDYSKIVSATLDVDNIGIYPTISNGIYNVSLGSYEELVVIVRNEFGEEIQTNTYFNNETIVVSLIGSASGVYFIKVFNYQGSNEFFKVIKL